MTRNESCGISCDGSAAPALPAERSAVQQGHERVNVVEIDQAVPLAVGIDPVAVRVTRPLGEYPPFKCPSCGKPAVYTVFYCLDCNKRFVPDLDRPAAAGPLRLPMGARCRACGSGHVCQYVAALPDQKPVGDAPWPKWQE